MKRKNFVWALNITYDASINGPQNTWFPLDAPLKAKFGNPASSGFGFGQRDIEFCFKSKKEAEAAELEAAEIAAKNNIVIAAAYVERIEGSFQQVRKNADACSDDTLVNAAIEKYLKPS